MRDPSQRSLVTRPLSHSEAEAANRQRFDLHETFGLHSTLSFIPTFTSPIWNDKRDAADGLILTQP
jgi:hypothetical protein